MNIGLLKKHEEKQDKKGRRFKDMAFQSVHNQNFNKNTRLADMDVSFM